MNNLETVGYYVPLIQVFCRLAISGTLHPRSSENSIEHGKLEYEDLISINHLGIALCQTRVDGVICWAFLILFEIMWICFFRRLRFLEYGIRKWAARLPDDLSPRRQSIVLTTWIVLPYIEGNTPPFWFSRLLIKHVFWHIWVQWSDLEENQMKIMTLSSDCRHRLVLKEPSHFDLFFKV